MLLSARGKIMPNLITHYLCGIDVQKTIKNKELRDFISKNQNIYNLGTQGPDVLFYYRIFPWTPKPLISNVGQEMHAKKVGKVFNSFFDYLVQQPENIKNMLCAYFMGFVCHNCLDSITHPYIFYKTGFLKKGERKTFRYAYYHHRFETNLDVILLKEKLGITPQQLKPGCKIDVAAPVASNIGKLYEFVLKKVYDYNIPGKHLAASIKDMIMTQKVLHDPTGILKKVITPVERLILKYPVVAATIFPKAVNDDIDYMNDHHNVWYKPFDIRKPHTESFKDLYNQAVTKTTELLEVLYHALYKDSSVISNALQLIGNNSYTSGMDSDKEYEFKYHDIVFSDII